MKTAMNGNGHTADLMLRQPLLGQFLETSQMGRPTVQQALSKWYRNLKDGICRNEEEGNLFGNLENGGILEGLKADLELIPELLMDELINNADITDKKQYLRLVQALLINLSDNLPESDLREQLCNEVETALLFIQDFFYQHFDFDFKVSVFCLKHLTDSISLKLEYWKIKLAQSPIIDVLQECILEKANMPENYISNRKVNYLQNIFRQIESATSIINENYIRELFIRNNLNTSGFINYEIALIENKLKNGNSSVESIKLLKIEQHQVSQWKDNPEVGYEPSRPSVRIQLRDWIVAKIKIEEFSNLKKNDKDLQIDTESKVQTSLSVSKLAVLIRLLVADKIIINKSAAPMLRTVAKLFTTLQKDEISFGSLETKYHAPDKATVNIMKEMLQKWVTLIGKL